MLAFLFLFCVEGLANGITFNILLERDKENVEYVRQNGLGQPGILAQDTIEYYKRVERWNMQVINVGATVDRYRFLEDPRELLDDKHHPYVYMLCTNISTFLATLTNIFSILLISADVMVPILLPT